MRLTARRIRKNEISGCLVSDDLGEIVGWVADAYNCNVTAAERERVERTTFPTLREALKDLDVWFDGDPGAPPREYMPVCRLVSERYRGEAGQLRERRPGHPPTLLGMPAIVNFKDWSMRLHTTAGVRVYGVARCMDGSASSFTCEAKPSGSLSWEEVRSRVTHGEPFVADAWCPSYRDKRGVVRYGRAWLEVTTL